MSESEKAKRIILSAMMLAMEKGVDHDLFAWCLLQTAALGYKESHGEEWIKEFAEACGSTVERLRDEAEEGEE